MLDEETETNETNCGSAFNLHSLHRPAGGNSSGCKEKSDCVEVSEKMTRLPSGFIPSVNIVNMSLWSPSLVSSLLQYMDVHFVSDGPLSVRRTMKSGLTL